MREGVLLPRTAIKTAVMDENMFRQSLLVKVWLGNGMPSISNIHYTVLACILHVEEC